MTDAPGGAGPCVRGWAKGVPDGDDIRSAHWMVTPIIPIITSHHYLHQPTMSFENVADFNSFFDGGREGSLSSNKENSVLRPRGEAQGQGSRPGGAIDWRNCSMLIYSPSWFLHPLVVSAMAVALCLLRLGRSRTTGRVTRSARITGSRIIQRNTRFVVSAPTGHLSDGWLRRW